MLITFQSIPIYDMTCDVVTSYSVPISAFEGWTRSCLKLKRACFSLSIQSKPEFLLAEVTLTAASTRKITERIRTRLEKGFTEYNAMLDWMVSNSEI